MSRKRWLGVGGIALAILVLGTMSGWAIATTNHYVRTDGSDLNDGTANDAAHAWLSIQHAIDSDSAADGDTINVAAGTYAESVVIDVGITLQGAAGAIIAPAAGPGIQIDVSPVSTPVTVDGFTITPQGSTLDTAQGIVIGSVATPVATYDITISNNSITTLGQNMGILVRGVGTNGGGYPNCSGLTVTDNAITLGGDSTAFYASWVTPAHANWTITGNTFDSPIGVNLQLHDVDGVTVDSNILKMCGSGGSTSVFFVAELCNLTSPIIFSNNDVQGSGANLVAFRTDMNTAAIPNTMDDVTVTGNTFDNWVVAADRQALGIYPRVTTVAVHQNNFAGTFATAGTGLRNTSGVAIDATHNWWGSKDGPTHAGNTYNVGSQGVAVSDNVDYVPWLNASSPGSVSFAPVEASSFYSSIQAAIDVALAGTVITCQPGTFTEDLTVNIANLTLQSTTGMTNATIQLVDTVGINIQGGGDGFKLGGAAGKGFTVKSGALTTFDIQLENAPSGVEISQNKIDTTGNASMGISVGAAGATSLTITDNTFVAENGDGSIWGPKVQDVIVDNNTFTGPASPTSGYAIQFAGVTASSPSTISENTITNYAMGIAVFNGEGTSDLLISDNDISDCVTGIRLGQYSPSTNGDMTTVQLSGNTLASNTTGLRIDSGANVKCDQFTVKLNNFLGNTTGLNNQHTTLAVTAEDNWWNSDSGPEHTSNPGGTGDPVSGNADVTPWLGSTVENTVSGDVTAPGTLDGRPDVDASVTVTGANTTVTLGQYAGNPTGTSFGTDEAGYIDVYVPDTSGVTQIEIRLYYDPAGVADENDLELHWWDGSGWVACSDQGVNTTDYYIWAKIRNDTTPTLAQLQGTIFVGGDPNLPASVVWYEDFEYTDQDAMEAAGWVFGTNSGNLWHLATEAAVPSLAYPNLTSFPSPTHAVWFGKASSGSYAYGVKSVSPTTVDPQARAQQARIHPMAGGGYPYGELTSPGIGVAGQTSVKVSFDFFREVECYSQGTYDKTYAQVGFDGGPWQTIWSRDSQYCWDPKSWIPASIDGIPVYDEWWIPVAVPAGAANMQIRFVFDAVDNVANDFLGWLIDDLKVSSEGPAGLRFEERNLPEGLAGQRYEVTIHAVGGTASEGYTWRVISQPDWIDEVVQSLSSIAFAGTPPAGPTTTYDLCVGVGDDRGQTYEECFSIVIEQFVSGGELFYDDFETVPDPDWTTTGLWHRTQNTPCISPPYASPTHVYYYGKDATCNYVTAGKSSGALVSPSIDVSGIVAGSQLTIGWKYWRETEFFAKGVYDQTKVEYRFDQGDWEGLPDLWYDDCKQQMDQYGWWLEEVLVSKPIGAKELQVQFLFDTVDGYANNFRGWLIDDVKVVQPVPGVEPLEITTVCEDLPDGQVSVAYDAQLSATGGVTPYEWTWDSAVAGLTLNPDTGVLNGKPTAAGSFVSTFTVTDNVGNTDLLQCTIDIAPAGCPCDLASLNFENALTDQTLALSWTVTGLWHVAANGCANCGGSGNDYGYFGKDATCRYNTGGAVTGHLTSPEITLDACIDNIAIGFEHYRWVESYLEGSYDRTSVQVRWNTGTWGGWQIIWLKDSNDPSPDDCLDVAIGPVPVPAGATRVQVRFGFESVDDLFNNFTGWAVDGIWVKNSICAPQPTTGPTSLSALQVKEASRDEVTVLNVPNPVRDVHTTTFSVRGVGIEAVRIQIFDINQNLVFEEEVPGTELVWHTVDEYGEYLANGVYFYRALVSQGGVWITTGFQKLVILR